MKLEPCPFCGSGVLHKNNPEKMGRTFFVSCGFCDCRGACLPTEQGAIDAWNTRADEFAAMARDAERLDWLDDLNKKFNERTGTTYGWKLDWTCNRWALSDCNLPALTVREAIDAAMAERNK